MQVLRSRLITNYSKVGSEDIIAVLPVFVHGRFSDEY